MTDTSTRTEPGDWATDQEVRWCPGCGDYSILTAMRMLMPELEVDRENTVFVSGIGCAARFPGRGPDFQRVSTVEQAVRVLHDRGEESLQRLLELVRQVVLVIDGDSWRHRDLH